MRARFAAACRQGQSFAAGAAARVIDLLYPTTCAACEAFVHTKGPLCPDCLSQLQRLESAAACPVCAKPLAQHGDPCPYCEGSGEPNFDRIVRLGVYIDPIRHLVYQMKYHRQWPLAEFFADRLIAQTAPRELLMAADCLAAVPLHPLRQVARGYNQASVLTERLAGRLGKRGKKLRVISPLVRTRNTETQTVVHSRTRREENLRGAFALVDSGSVEGRHVVIVDDVTTTGATLQAAARSLKSAKPASLSALVVAIADPKGTEFSEI